MSEPPHERTLDEKVHAVYEKALDVALAADASEVAALELGIRAGEMLLNARVVAPPKPTLGIRDDESQEDITAAMLRIDPIALELGADLTRLADPEVSGELLERLKHVRRRIAMEFGVIAPGVRVRPHAGLEPGAYQIRVKGDLVAEGEVLTTHMLGIGQDLEVPGVEVEHTTDPIYKRPAVWIPTPQASLGEGRGLQMFDAQDVVATHMAEVVKQHLAELLSREVVAQLLEMARQDSPMVVQELLPNMLSLGQLRQVLQHLVKDQVPIKDLSTILNALADNAIYTKDPHALAEHVRAALGRKICGRYQSPDGLLRAFMLSPDAERAIQNSIQLNETGQVLMLDPATSQAIQNNLADALSRFRGVILDPVIITPPKIRRHVKTLLERHFSKIVVLSYSEIVSGVQVENLEMIEAKARPGSAAVDFGTGAWLDHGQHQCSRTEDPPPAAPPAFELGADAVTALEAAAGDRPVDADLILRQFAEVIRSHARDRDCIVRCPEELAEPLRALVGTAFPEVHVVGRDPEESPPDQLDRHTPDYLAVASSDLGDSMHWSW